jgi:hypothetical protein
MRSYNSLNRKKINISVKQSNILSNAFQNQYLGNGVSVSSESSGNINLSSYALISYVDASINAVYANFATGTSSLNLLTTQNAVQDTSINSLYSNSYIDASFNAVYTKTYVDASFDSVIVQNTSQNVLLNGNVQLGSGNKSVGINTTANPLFSLDVSGETNVTGNVTVVKKGSFGYVTAPTNTLYELDISGQTRIYEAIGSDVTTSASVATLTLEHGDASGCSSIMFKSPSTTSNGDYAYIKYQDLSGGATNSGRLTIGVENDPIAPATADKISLYAAGGSGFVGVNTLNPAFNLDISGNTNVSSTLITNTINTSTTTSNFNLGTNVAGTLSTNGLINIGQQGATASAGTINIGIGSSQTGAINIGSGASTKNITIGSTTGGTTTIRGGDISLNGGASGAFDLFSTSTTGGRITIGAATGNQILTIQRPVRVVAGSDPANVSFAVGYEMPNVTGTSGVIGKPTDTYTWSTGVMNLGIGVWIVSLYAELVTAATVMEYNYNMGFMSSVPTTGDSASASKAPGNTISGINGNQRSDDNTNLTNGIYAYQVGGIVLNNYGGTYNTLYGIFNADWATSGTIAMTKFTLRAARIA